MDSRMDILVSGLSGILAIVPVILVLAGVMKLFQIHTTLVEILESLRAASRIPGNMPAASAGIPMATPANPASSQAASPTALHAMGSGEDMLRALDAEMRMEEATARNPEVVNPRF